MPRIKFCGMTNVDDVLAACALGVDAIGLIFYAASPRAVTIEQAKKIIANLPPFVTTVGVFVNANAKEIHSTLAKVALDVLQFHGQEEAEFCQQFNKPFIKTIHIAGQKLAPFFTRYAMAQGLLLDAYQPGVPGGTGISFNWDEIPRERPKPIILAGCLEPSNIARAIQTVNPYGVDVVSGIEDRK